jgi:uncharacterized protein (DUF885 family)
LNSNEKFEKLKNSLFDELFKENPTFASFMGLHDPYDHLLPKGDTAHILRSMKILQTYLKRVKDTVDFDSLSDTSKIDWHIMEKAVEFEKFEFYELRHHELNPDAFGLIGGALHSLITRDYAPLEKRVEAVISRLEQVPQYLKEFRTRFDNSTSVKLWTEIAFESAQRIPGLFQFIAMASKGQISPELHGKLQKAIENLKEPLQEHLNWLAKLKQNTVEEWSIGREKFEKLITLRGLGMTSDQIHDVGTTYLKELKGERARIASKIAPGKSVDEVIKVIEKHAPKTFEDALAETKKAMEEAKQFVIDKNLATVYEEDRLIVEETPAYLAPIIPFAALMMPSRFDKPMIGTYIVTRPKEQADLGNHLNYPSIRNTAVHEAFPGHFLQLTVSNRSSLIHLLASGTETVEGWAHYCEQMMMEHGFLQGNEAKLVQVNDALWRAVRIIVDVRLSRGEMSFDEAVNMLVKEVGMSKAGASAEVRRYTQSPGQPLSYLLGKHLILQLKEEVKGKMGERFSEKFFHDTITSNGLLPIHLLRKVFDLKIA